VREVDIAGDGLEIDQGQLDLGGPGSDLERSALEVRLAHGAESVVAEAEGLLRDAEEVRVELVVATAVESPAAAVSPPRSGFSSSSCFSSA